MNESTLTTKFQKLFIINYLQTLGWRFLHWESSQFVSLQLSLTLNLLHIWPNLVESTNGFVHFKSKLSSRKNFQSAISISASSLTRVISNKFDCIYKLSDSFSLQLLKYDKAIHFCSILQLRPASPPGVCTLYEILLNVCVGGCCMWVLCWLRCQT